MTPAPGNLAESEVPVGAPVWSIVARAMADMGAVRCFGLVGGANFKVTHALTEHGLAFVSARHECGAVVMADAATRLSGELNIVSVTAGPGLTNAITGIGEAVKSDTPMVVLAGDVALGDEVSSFSIRQRELVHSVGAHWTQIDDAATSYRDALAAASLALAERCVVVVSLPIDIQELAAELAATNDRVAGRATPPGRVQPRPGAIAALVDLVEGASRPIVLAGHGAGVADAETGLTELADALGALLATSLAAHGTFSRHPWNLGISGGYASPAAAELIRQADLVIAFGASLNDWTTKKGQLVSRARVVQVDNREGRFERFREVDLQVLGDAASVAAATVAELRSRGGRFRDGWRTDDVAAVIHDRSHGSIAYAEVGDDRYVDPRSFTKAVDRILPRERVVVVDGGHFTGWPIHHLSVPDARSWCMPIAFQSIGLGLAAAIGAAVSRPDRLVVLAAGDGGFLMSLPELETAVRLGCRLCVLVYNDSAYSAEVHHYKADFPLDIVRFPEVDFSKIAHSVGAGAAVVRSASDFGPLAEWVEAGARGVFLLDARVHPDLAGDWFMTIVGSGKL